MTRRLVARGRGADGRLRIDGSDDQIYFATYVLKRKAVGLGHMSGTHGTRPGKVAGGREAGGVAPRRCM